jgi:hypothetical protein
MDTILSEYGDSHHLKASMYFFYLTMQGDKAKLSPCLIN